MILPVSLQHLSNWQKYTRLTCHSLCRVPSVIPTRKRENRDAEIGNLKLGVFINVEEFRLELHILPVNKPSHFDIIKMHEFAKGNSSLIPRDGLSNQWLQNEMTQTISGTLGKIIECGGVCTGNKSIYSLPDLGAYDSTIAEFCCTRTRFLCHQSFSFIKKAGNHIFKWNHPYFKILANFSFLLKYYSGCSSITEDGY